MQAELHSIPVAVNRRTVVDSHQTFVDTRLVVVDNHLDIRFDHCCIRRVPSVRLRLDPYWMKSCCCFCLGLRSRGLPQRHGYMSMHFDSACMVLNDSSQMAVEATRWSACRSSTCVLCAHTSMFLGTGSPFPLLVRQEANSAEDLPPHLGQLALR